MIRHLLTGADNQTYDIGRVLWAKLVLAYIGMTVWQVAIGHPMDPMTWATGAGAILAAGAGALRLKETTEPPAAQVQP